MFEKKKDGKSFILGVLAGGLIGSITSLLLAPKSGKRLRMDMISKKDELLNDADKIIYNAKNKASDIITDARKKAEVMLKDIKKKTESLTGDETTSNNKGPEEETSTKIKDALKSASETQKKVH